MSCLTIDHRPSFELAIAENPSDPTNYLIFADYLEDCGEDGYAELVRWASGLGYFPLRVANGSHRIAWSSNEPCWHGGGYSIPLSHTGYLKQKIICVNFKNMVTVTKEYGSISDALSDLRQAICKFANEPDLQTHPDNIKLRLNYANELERVMWPRYNLEDAALVSFLREWSTRQWWPKQQGHYFCWYDNEFYLNMNASLPTEIYSHMTVWPRACHCLTIDFAIRALRHGYTSWWLSNHEKAASLRLVSQAQGNNYPQSQKVFQQIGA